MCMDSPGPGGYVSPEKQQQAPPGLANYNGPFADKLKARSGFVVSPFQQAAEATARGNRPTQNTPFGSSSWSMDPATGQWTQNVGLSGPLSGANSSMQSQLESAWGTPLDNGAGARQHAEDAIYQREASRLDPMWNNREQANRTQLEQQGIDPNSEAGRMSMDTLGRSRNDAYSSALQEAIMGGGQEASRQQQMDLQSRLAPLMGMQGLQKLLQMPEFQQGPNYLGAAIADTSARQQQAEMNNQMMNAYLSEIMGGGASIGAAAIGKK